jgi:hypothetical protein
MKVHGKGVEPIRLAAAEPKSAASASFATRAVILSGNEVVILAESSVFESSGMRSNRGPNSPRFPRAGLAPVFIDHRVSIVARAVRDPGLGLTRRPGDRHEGRPQVVCAKALAAPATFEEMGARDADAPQIAANLVSKSRSSDGSSRAIVSSCWTRSLGERGRPAPGRTRLRSYLAATFSRYRRKMVSGDAIGRHLGQPLSARRLAFLGQKPTLCVGQAYPLRAETAAKHPVLRPQVFDRFALSSPGGETTLAGRCGARTRRGWRLPEF